MNDAEILIRHFDLENRGRFAKALAAWLREDPSRAVASVEAIVSGSPSRRSREDLIANPAPNLWAAQFLTAAAKSLSGLIGIQP